ncbi:primase-helicase family protein [Lacinutrix sp. Bg11-31]|uniref:primase-helicase family protein n=1 Tax=Lacinutrix sp. Bg11-31 TaxID=2057808 RepID=UPI000C30FC7E|nr:primase-helicase family protein [Lacinutrix sp. Bg11-31]AUC81801.1 helicase [Lacinutrix sp. Bg11-31]
MEYIRVGTDYYRVVDRPLLSGDTINTLVKWTKGEIITDYGKDYIADIPKYNGFVTMPSNINYEKEIKGFYNGYHEIGHELKQGLFNRTESFLKHIFGEQYEIGLDYLTIIWQQPTQVLPILCLVSEDRKTGKTTFLNWLKQVFQKNMTINKNEDFRSQFNADWATKLIIAIDEVLLDRREDSERIKNLSTSRTYKMENKGKDKIETPFFGKFILCSNNEDNFILVDEKEIRYWVRKVPSIIDADENTELLEDLEKEIPCFLNHLNTRKIATPKKSRMWFSKEEIFTPALSRLVKGNKTNLEKEIIEIVNNDFFRFEKETICYSASDLVELLKNNNIRASSSKVSEVLKSKFGLLQKNSSYKRYNISSMLYTKEAKTFIEETIVKGRYYEFKIESFE